MYYCKIGSIHVLQRMEPLTSWGTNNPKPIIPVRTL
jgi:hypothetical protein